MFHSARLTLTAWYLVIIMTISIVFSIGFYNVATKEFQRIIRVQEFRQDHPDEMAIHPRAIIIKPLSRQDFEEASKRLSDMLIGLNAVIFVVTGAAGYFLAGRTLRPIKEMVDEQHRFITDASHELRTPLTSLRSEIEVALRDTSLSQKEARALLESNLEEVIGLQALSDNLLTLTQNGKGMQTQEVSISEALDSAEKRLNGSFKKKHITLKRDVGEETVKGVFESMTSLFVILLDNAVKYSPKKSTITVSAKREGDSVTITVSDQGMGIDGDDLPHVFDRFYRANTSRSKEHVTGYGLGLSIAKKIVSSHKGTISVTSHVDSGTTFTIKLPHAS